MKLRKIITGWISVFLVITLVSISAKEYSDDYFDKNETDVRQTCTGTLTSDDDKEMCNAYYQYVQNKAAKAKRMRLTYKHRSATTKSRLISMKHRLIP